MISLILQTDALRLSFHRRQDRYAQRLAVAFGESFIDLWESVDSPRLLCNEQPEDWPPSPPWQDVHIETRSDGVEIALAVGQAGSSHWSLSVEPVPGGQGLLFDVACRVKSLPRWLGNSYRRISTLGAHADLYALLDFAFAPSYEELTRTETNRYEWRISPAVLTGPFPRTIRWQYQVVSRDSAR
ncbi:MAG TPA: hypothetical protein VFE24_11755 [Pirellulales bacterium]|nr:hypothetical protein [Pirellulales bacterium]